MELLTKKRKSLSHHASINALLQLICLPVPATPSQMEDSATGAYKELLATLASLKLMALPAAQHTDRARNP
jgi:hypothetical protein